MKRSISRFVAVALAATLAASVAGGGAFAAGAMVTQVSTVALGSGATAINVGTINSQFSSITVDASGETTWCNDFPDPPCTSSPDGATNYSFLLGPGAPLPGQSVGTVIGKIGPNGDWFVIGSHFVATSSVVADLYVAYDDDVYGDNSGSYTLTITRVKPAT